MTLGCQLNIKENKYAGATFHTHTCFLFMISSVCVYNHMRNSSSSQRAEGGGNRKILVDLQLKEYLEKEMAELKISYHGHSVVKVETGQTTILIDPFISGNEACDLDASTVKADVILLTHAHNDHVGDTFDIAKRNDALVVAPNELAVYLGGKGLNTQPMHIGGAHQFDFGKVKLTQAFHGSAYTEEDGTTVYGGMPAGILLTVEGKTIYHLGDTALFTDLKMYGEMNDIDIAFIPIGDNFTMGPEDALVAAEWVDAKITVPVHYDTFPVIRQNPHAFAEKVKNGEGKVMEIGGVIEL